MTNLLYLFLISLASLTMPGAAEAHPLDEIGDVNLYDQKQVLTVFPSESELKIELTFYAFEKNKVWESIDINKDQELSRDEKEKWMKRGQESSWIEKSGNRYSFEAQKTDIPEYHDFFSPEPSRITIVFTTEVDLFPNDEITYRYQGKDKQLAEINLEVKGKDGLGVMSLEPRSTDGISFIINNNPGTFSGLNNSEGSEKLQNFLNKYVKADNLPASVVVYALFASFLIGMLHALTPGHGKAIVAGYLIGEKGNLWQAVQLGLIITITHTASVFLLGLSSLLLTQYVVPETVIKAMNFVSGILITAFGVYLVVKRIRNLRSKVSTDHLHTHSHPHTHSHSHEEDHHSHEELPITWKNLLPLGISGGIVPCIDALAILIVAISLGKIVLGLTLLIFFSIGLAGALIIGGVFVVYAKNKAIRRINTVSRYERYISLASALVVTLLGVLLLFGKGV